MVCDILDFGCCFVLDINVGFINLFGYLILNLIFLSIFWWKDFEVIWFIYIWFFEKENCFFDENCFIFFKD